MRSLRLPSLLKSWLATLAVAALLLPTLGSADPMAHFDKLGHQLMCTCGCGQILLECNHVGCPMSDGMRAELRTAMNTGQSDKLIYAGFINKYGPTVMAAPVFAGFNILAWTAPVAALLLGTLGATLLIQSWKRRLTRQAPAQADTASLLTESLRERIRKESEL